MSPERAGRRPIGKVGAEIPSARRLRNAKKSLGSGISNLYGARQTGGLRAWIRTDRALPIRFIGVEVKICFAYGTTLLIIILMRSFGGQVTRARRDTAAWARRRTGGGTQGGKM